MPPRRPLPTIHGYEFGVAASALQKFIRRGMEREAMFMAGELERSDYHEYVWKRLRVIASEDVGLAWPEGPAVIRALYENYVQFRKQARPERPGHRLFLMHAVLLLSRAPKSRIVDHATLAMYRQGAMIDLDSPEYDFVFDQHTARGRRLGRGIDHFLDEGAALVDEDPNLPDDYKEEARILFKKDKAGLLPTPGITRHDGQESLDLSDLGD